MPSGPVEEPCQRVIEGCHIDQGSSNMFERIVFISERLLVATTMDFQRVAQSRQSHTRPVQF